MPKIYEIKPNKTAFVTYRFLISLISSFIFFTILYFVINRFFGLSIIIFIALYIISAIFGYYLLTIRYKKERYIFMPGKIIHKAGSLFSDSETELVLKNITHVNMQLPFIMNKLFNVGNVRIQSAGSIAAEVSMFAIDDSGKIYEYVRTLMQTSGFSVKKSKLIQSERPSPLGVFFETVKWFFIWLYSLGMLVVVAFSMLEKLNLFKHTTLIIAITIAGVLFSLLMSLFKFLDLINRRYNVYNDTITYKEGFLTKNYALLPIENLADATTSQNLVDKIFGLYDVKISCQGRGQEVLFKNMVNGKQLEQNIDLLAAKSKSLSSKQQSSKEIGSELTSQKSNGAKQKTATKKAALTLKSLTKDNKFNGSYSRDGRRVLIPLLVAFPFCLILFPLFIPWFFFFLSELISLYANKYFVKTNSIEHKFDFINSKHTEFTTDKIMAIIIKENFIDKWFNTCSLKFWSIGSGQDITFKNIKKEEGLYQNVLSKLGIKQQDLLYHVDSNFGFFEMLKANLFGTLILAGLIVGFLISSAFNLLLLIPLIFIVLLYILSIVYREVYYQRSKMRFYKDYVYFQRGIFFREFYYVPYNNIKDITTVKYPLSSLGVLSFNIAGESVVQQGKQQTIVSNSFTIHYADNIETKDELIDMIFYSRPTKKKIAEMEQNIDSFMPVSLLHAKPALANTLVPFLIASFVIFPLLLLLPITLPLVILSIKVKSYIIQPYRVVSKWGIIYKKQKSVVFNKVDHINFYQGMLNKMFNNGTITINTIGSSTTELMIKNIPNHKEFYELLKKNY
ncbi:PH domain-containing protein [Candidatus Woesearchaeota archaeon]|nr:PH domain-containing protein [Candidatus Woesearchaeota archaeon]MBT7926942.1 PH domain-containing protein [Candidatus Woesearchaeota archaeon]